LTYGDGEPQPISGAVVITVISDFESMGGVLGYMEREKGSREKHLIKPISAVYHANYMNPLLNTDPIKKYIKTNSSGQITMQNVFFSIYGPAGKYTLTFWANGTFVQT
jgi:hypothetical protein